MGKGGGSSVIPTYAGLRYDIETLLSKFKDNGSPRFTVFRQLFQEQNFSKIFAGRLAPVELVEFSERLLQMAAEYMHPNKMPTQPVYLDGAIPLENIDDSSRSLLERLYGVYLTYALFFLQPSNYVVQVRVTPVQMNECRNLLEKLIEDNHLDAVACMMKLIAHRAFHVVAFSGSFDPTSHRRYELAQEDDDNVADFTEPPFSDLKAFVTDPLVKQLELLSQTTSKCSYKQPISKIKEVAEHAQYPVVLDGGIETLVQISSGSERKGIKDRHYIGEITHSRNRRYADPNYVAGSSLENIDESQPEPEQTPVRPSSSTPVKGKGGRGRKPKTNKNGETDTDTPAPTEEPSKKRGRPSNNKTNSLETESMSELLEDLDSESKKTTVKITPKRPAVKDTKFHAKMKSVSARSKKQKENDLLLADLMKE